MLTVSSPSAVAKGDINVPQVSSGDKSGKLMLKKGVCVCVCVCVRERERERERERVSVCVRERGWLWNCWYVKWEEQMLPFES